MRVVLIVLLVASSGRAESPIPQPRCGVGMKLKADATLAAKVNDTRFAQAVKRRGLQPVAFVHELRTRALLAPGTIVTQGGKRFVAGSVGCSDPAAWEIARTASDVYLLDRVPYAEYSGTGCAGPRTQNLYELPPGITFKGTLAIEHAVEHVLECSSGVSSLEFLHRLR